MGGTDTVVEEVFQAAVAYHISFLAHYALVVEIAGTAVAHNGGVIDNVHALRAYLLAHLIREYGRALANEIGLESVAHSLVEQDSGGSGTHHDRHLAALRPPGFEEGIDVLHGTLHHFVHGLIPGLAALEESLGTDAETAVACSRNCLSVSGFEDCTGYQGVERTVVPAQFSEGVVHHYFALAVAEPDDDLLGSRIGFFDSLVNLHQHSHEGLVAHLSPKTGLRVEIWVSDWHAECLEGG